MKKERIDKLLIENNFAPTIAKAQAMIMAGIVVAAEKRVDKSSETFSPETIIRIKGASAQSGYVGRGGLKLEKALEGFQICVDEYVCLDVGASTGGFTDCLLQNGAGKVIAVDAGTNQLDWKLRSDSRVEVRENTNARYLKSENFIEKFDLIVMDVSFISVKRIIPALIPLLKNDGRIIVLIKPQFEVGKTEVGAGGVVREPEKHERVIKETNSFAEKCGLRNVGLIDSPILGAEGNREFLALYCRNQITSP